MLFYSAISLVMSCICIWFMANFVVDTLGLVGFITELPSAMMGVTFLAMGNSVSDFIADMSIATINFVDMAITGTYAGPTFNIMLGMGMVIIINCTLS